MVQTTLSLLLVVLVASCMGNNVPVKREAKVCRDGFINLGSGCYYFGTNHQNWYNAFKTCVALGANLASVETFEENVLIKQHLRSLAHQKNWWISGIDDSQEGYFVWANTLNPVAYTDWCSGDPNNYGIENCMYFGYGCDFSWQDRNCEFKQALEENWWISGTDDQQEGYFTWMSSLAPVVYTDWCPNDPNNIVSENCIRFVYECDFAWQDHSCHNPYTRYICEQN